MWKWTINNELDFAMFKESWNQQYVNVMQDFTFSVGTLILGFEDCDEYKFPMPKSMKNNKGTNLLIV